MLGLHVSLLKRGICRHLECCHGNRRGGDLLFSLLYTPEERYPAISIQVYREVMSYCLTSAALLFWCFVASAQTPPALEVGSLPQHMDAGRFGIRVDNGVLSGTGADVLTAAINSSHYILIGEDHLTREIPQFTAAICNLTSKRRLTGMALEVSPEAAAFMMQIVNSPERWQKMVAQPQAYPESIAMLDSRQEGDMVANCVQDSNNPSFHLWGLDQNFIGSAGWLIDRMLAAKPGPKARVALLRLKADERRDAAAARANADTSALFLLSQNSDAEINEAQPAIDRDGGTEVKTTFAELASSYQLYRAYGQGYWVNDVMRAKFLRTNFRDAMNQIPPSVKTGKIIVKFGDWHICILSAAGKQSAFSKYGQPYQIQANPATTDPLYRWMKPFLDKQIPNQWTLYDLRALRYQHLGALDSEVRRILDGYDFLVIVPSFTAAEMAD
jgi:hypothetical protein